MDFTSTRILIVIIGTVLANSGYVLSQGGGGIAIGFGMGGDMMMDTPMGELPTQLLAMSGDPANQQLNTGGGGLMGGAPGGTAGGTGGGLDPAFLMNIFGSASAPILFPSSFTSPALSSPIVFLPGSIGISDQQNAAASSSKSSSVDQVNREPNYVLQNEAFTALGNVGHLVRVPVERSTPIPATVILNQIPASASSTQNKHGSTAARTLVQLPSPTANTLGNSASNRNTVSITGEPVAVFNPGTGLASEMAVLQASLTGEAVDMAGFAPPPFTVATSNTKPVEMSQNAQQRRAEIGNRLLQGPGKQVAMSLTGTSSRRAADQTLQSGSVNVNEKVSASRSGAGSNSHLSSPPQYITEPRVSKNIKSNKAVPHVEDLVTDGIYPFEGSSAARSATLDRKMQVVSDLENAIKASGSEALHLESSPSLSANSLAASASISSLKINMPPEIPNRSSAKDIKKVSLKLSDSSSSRSKTFSSTSDGVSNVASGRHAFDSKSAAISSLDSKLEPRISLRIPHFPTNEQPSRTSGAILNTVREKTARISFVTPPSVTRTAKLTIKPLTDTASNVRRPDLKSKSSLRTAPKAPVASLSGLISADKAPTTSNKKATLVVDTSSFLSQAPREKTVNDPNYVTVMGNLVGVIESKDIPTADSTINRNRQTGVASFINSAGIAADSAQGVLTGSNGAPITNMAGIRMPNYVADPANQPAFDANSPVLSSGKNILESSFSSGRPIDSNNPGTVPGGSFIIGAGQPNARMVKSIGLPEPRRSMDTGVDVSRNVPMVQGSTQGSGTLAKTNAQLVDINTKGQQTQGFAVDLSAFSPPTYKIPSLDISTFNLITSNSPVTSDLGKQNNVDKQTFEAPKQQTANNLLGEAAKTNTRGQIIKKTQKPQIDNVLNTQSTKASQTAAIVKPNLISSIEETLRKTSQVQQIVNVEPGWANSLFPMERFALKPKDTPKTPLKTVQPEVVNVDTKVKDAHLDTSLNKPYEIQNPHVTPNVQQKKPIVGFFSGENNPHPSSNTHSTILNQARGSSGPAVDFMTSFFNNQNLNIRRNTPLGSAFNNVATSIRDRDAKAVDQFGVADIYTRKQRLNQSQWRNLLSSVSGPSSRAHSDPKDVKYDTVTSNTQRHTQPITSNKINPSAQPWFLKNQGGTPTSIRTMFEAPGVSIGDRNVNSGLESGFSKQIRSVFTVPMRQEFVASNPTVSRPTSNSVTNPASQKRSIEMPMFQQVPVQRNLVAAPDSGSTRAFDTTNMDRRGQRLAGSSQSPTGSLVQPGKTKTFTIGKSVVVGDSLSPDLQSKLNTADSSNLNQFASTGLRLGQPVVTQNTKTSDRSQPLTSSNTQFTNRQDGGGSQFTSGNRVVVFGTSETGVGRTIGAKSAVSASSKPLGSVPSSAACNYKPDPTSNNHFILEYRGFRHRFRCALGSAFDAATCQCSTLVSGSGDCLEVHMDFNNGKVEDASINRLPIGVENVEVTNQSTPLTGIALFGDNSKLTIWRYQNFDFRDHIMLKVQFRPGTGGGRFQPLISNCDSMRGGPSVAVVYDSKLREVLLVLKTDNDTTKELTFTVNPNEWNDVTYIYDGQEFIGIVNGVRRYISRQDPHLLGIIGGEIKSLPTQGLIEIRDAALLLGYCPQWGHYVGAMVDIQVYTCIPRDFRLE